MKKKSRYKKRRSVYPYTCKGCKKRRMAFVYERAKAEVCQTCEIAHFVDENQAKMF